MSTHKQVRTRPLGAVGILLRYRQLNTQQPAGATAIAWTGRIVSGIVEGLGLLALVQLGTAVSTGQPAGGFTASGWMRVLVVCAIVGGISVFFREKTSYNMAFNVMRRVHHVIGDKLSILPLGWFSSTTTGSFSRLGASTVNELGNLSAHMLTSMTTSLTTLITLLSGLLIWYPFFGGMLTVCLVVYVALMWVLSLTDSWAHNYKEPAATELSARVVEFAACQLMLRSTSRLDYPQLKQAMDDNRVRSMKSLIVEAIGNFIAGMSAQSVAVVMIFTAVQQGIAGGISPLETVAVVGISVKATEYLTTISEARTGLLLQSPTMTVIGRVMDAKPLSEPVSSAAQLTPGSLELRDVNFSYVKDAPVLRDVSFEVPARTMTALVGPSGSGKTTIARLFCRFWDANSGEVVVGGANVRALTTADLMSQVSMVFQDVYLFNDTLEANVRVGNPAASDEDVRQAARLAGVSEIVERLPDGWDTQVGEGGTALSGGERQRVSIARAILKKAPIVLFDEATSALDAENEANLTRAFNTLRQEATVLVIAHKLNTIAQADQIVVLNNQGMVAQRGTHEELVAVPGLYRAFWTEREKAAGWKMQRNA